jgi:transcriptional accessory protein Tex/SPT6
MDYPMLSWLNAPSMESTQQSKFSLYLTRVRSELPHAPQEKLVELVKSGLSIPAIFRFHGSEIAPLTEDQVFDTLAAFEAYEEIEKYQTHLLREIQAQKQLTPELEEKILSTYHLSVLEDIYLPFKLKGRTTATIAKEAGLSAFADWIWDVGHDLVEAKDSTIEAKALEFVKAIKISEIL